MIVFHAGKALETSLQVIYARTNNRILGREYPGVSADQMAQERRTHSLEALYDRIMDSFETRADLRKKLEDEFESAYQTVYHEGLIDLKIDGELMSQFFFVENTPFSPTYSRRLIAEAGTPPDERICSTGAVIQR